MRLKDLEIDGVVVDELVTAISSPTDSQIPTAKAVEAYVTAAAPGGVYTATGININTAMLAFVASSARYGIFNACTGTISSAISAATKSAILINCSVGVTANVSLLNLETSGGSITGAGVGTVTVGNLLKMTNTTTSLTAGSGYLFAPQTVAVINDCTITNDNNLGAIFNNAGTIYIRNDPNHVIDIAAGAVVTGGYTYIYAPTSISGAAFSAFGSTTGYVELGAAVSQDANLLPYRPTVPVTSDFTLYAPAHGDRLLYCLTQAALRTVTFSDNFQVGASVKFFANTSNKLRIVPSTSAYIFDIESTGMYGSYIESTYGTLEIVRASTTDYIVIAHTGTWTGV